MKYLTLKKQVFMLVLLLCFAAALFAGGKRDKFEIAYSGLTCGSPLAIALLNGFYDDEGVNIDLVSGTSFDAQMAALATGRMPVINGDFQFFPGIENGLDIKIVSGLHEGCIKLVVPRNSPIQSIRDLKGKTVLVDGIGGTPMMVTAVAAGRAGLNPRVPGDISWKPFPWDQLVQALDKGEGDAAALWDPFATLAERSGKYRVLLDNAKDPIFAGKNCCFIFASGKLIKEEPEVIAQTLRAIQRATAWVGENPEETARILIEKKKVAASDKEFISALIASYKYHHHHGAASIAGAKKDALFFTEELKKIGYLKADLDAQAFVDAMFVDVFALTRKSEQTGELYRH